MLSPMAPQSYVPNRRLWLKNHPSLTEKWVQQRIADEPSVLGLGDLEFKGSERRHDRAGRLDMLLYDAVSNTRYEVELQLGATDESHIVRTIEYWDLERRRYPQYDHVGVIVAEEITARFFNVIGLFNGFIPIVAVQMAAIEVGDVFTLFFTTVLDRTVLGIEEEEHEEARDRSYWEGKAPKASLAVMDRLIDLAREIESGVGPKYNKNYVGLIRSGVATNFLVFRPKQKHVIFEAKLPSSEEWTQRLEDAGIELLAYNRWGYYRMRVTDETIDEHKSLLLDLILAARDQYDA